MTLIAPTPMALFKPHPEERLLAVVRGRKFAIDLKFGDYVDLRAELAGDPIFGTYASEGHHLVLNVAPIRTGVRVRLLGAPWPLDLPVNATLPVAMTQWCAGCGVEMHPDVTAAACESCVAEFAPHT